MPRAIPNPQPHRNNGPRPEAPRTGDDQGERSRPLLDFGVEQADQGVWDQAPRRGGLGSVASETQTMASLGQGTPPEVDLSEMEKLLSENSQLRGIISELQDMVEETTHRADQALAERQREYEGLLEEKSELIRGLHLKLKEAGSQAPAPAPPDEDELLRFSRELEQERCQIQQERRRLEEDLRQFKEDERVMTQQMREMEVLMARERAELARQRSELQRILDEIRLELERIERDRGLNEKLVQLRQRFQNVAKGRAAGSAEPPPQSSGPAPQPGTREDAGSRKKDSGIMRRLFG